MSRPVRIAELKANLSAYLRRVKRGQTLTVMDRDTPIAQLGPIQQSRPPIAIRRATGNLRDVHLPAPLRIKSDIVALLLEERGER